MYIPCLQTALVWASSPTLWPICTVPEDVCPHPVLAWPSSCSHIGTFKKTMEKMNVYRNKNALCVYKYMYVWKKMCVCAVWVPSLYDHQRTPTPPPVVLAILSSHLQVHVSPRTPHLLWRPCCPSPAASCTSPVTWVQSVPPPPCRVISSPRLKTMGA